MSQGKKAEVSLAASNLREQSRRRVMWETGGQVEVRLRFVWFAARSNSARAHHLSSPKSLQRESFLRKTV